MALMVGRAISRMSGLIGNSLSSVGVFVAGAHVVSVGWSFVQAQKLIGLHAAPSAANPMAALALFQSGWYWAGIVVSLLIGAFSMAGAVGGMLRIAGGGRVGVGDCVAIGLRKLVPVAILTVLWVLGLTLGFALLIAPGVILVAMWSVALPVLVASEGGIGEAFGRSRLLTRGARLKILLLLLIVVVVAYAVTAGLLMVAGVPLLGGRTAAAATASGAMAPLGMAMRWLGGTAMALVIDAMLVALYIELEGPGSRLGEVFA